MWTDSALPALEANHGPFALCDLALTGPRALRTSLICVFERNTGALPGVVEAISLTYDVPVKSLHLKE
jgi:hypothetical protein